MLGSTRAGVNQGQIIRLEIQYYDQAGNFVDPSTTPSVSIVDPTNTIIFNANGSSGVSRQDAGLFYFDYTVPINGTLGSWQDIWSVQVGGTPFNTVLNFSVTQLISPVTASAGQEIDPELSQTGAKNVSMLMK